MKLDIKDRVPTLPNRVLVTPEGNGSPYYATITRADEPTQEGTPINKQLLDDMTTAENVQVSDEFAELLQLDSDNKDVENALRVIEDKRYGWENVSYMFNMSSAITNAGASIPTILFSWKDKVYCFWENNIYEWDDENIKWSPILSCSCSMYDTTTYDFNEETGIFCCLTSRVRSGQYTTLYVIDIDKKERTVKTLNSSTVYNANGTTKYSIMPSTNTYANSYDCIAFEHNGNIYVAGVIDSNRSYYGLCKVDMENGNLIYCRQTSPINSLSTYSDSACYIIRGKENKLFIQSSLHGTNAVRLENLEVDSSSKNDVSYSKSASATTSDIAVRRLAKNVVRGKYCWVGADKGLVIRTFSTKNQGATVDSITDYVENRISNTTLYGTTIPNASACKIILHKGYLYVCGYYSGGSSGSYIGTIRKRFDPTVIDNIEGEV